MSSRFLSQTSQDSEILEYISRLEEQDIKCEKKEKPAPETKKSSECTDEIGTGFVSVSLHYVLTIFFIFLEWTLSRLWSNFECLWCFTKAYHEMLFSH